MNSCAFEGVELKKKKMHILTSKIRTHVNGTDMAIPVAMSGPADGFVLTWIRLQNQH